MANERQLSDYDPDGTKLGQDASDKVGFWGATPIVRPSGSTQAAITSTGLTSTTNGAVANAPAASVSSNNSSTIAAAIDTVMTSVNKNFAEVVPLVSAMRTALVNAGIMKGSA